MPYWVDSENRQEAAVPGCEDTMMLASIENINGVLIFQRSNDSNIKDIKGGVEIWFVSVAFFGGLGLAGYALNLLLRQVGDPPMSPFLTPGTFLLLISLFGLAVLLNLVPSVVGLTAPRAFTLDAGRNAFLVEGRSAGRLDRLRIVLQDGFGPSRRAFRVVARVDGRDHVLAHTQRFTAATFAGREYPSAATQEGLRRKYWCNRWADYEGGKTGYDPAWPEYRELFALYEQLTNYTEAFETTTPVA